MSKINAVRIVNLSYNYNATKIEDEVFQLGGESTLFELDNGGGKTVLVQMLTAPFVHKSDRNTADRTFAGYFTSNQPTHIMTEWCLDMDAGYVLVGMMVRKASKGKEEGMDELEVISYIHEYDSANAYDIYSMPFVEEHENKKTLRGFVPCKKLFEQIRQDRGIHFRSYDVTTPYGQRQYFEHLKQYGIDYREWESIIKKVNIKESGLSELFRNCKNETGLLETWFIPTVQRKLNQEQDRIHQFRDMMRKYCMQYKQNESKLKRKDAIINFEEDTKGLFTQAESYCAVDEQKHLQEQKIAYLIKLLKQKTQELEGLQQQCQTESDSVKQQLLRVEYEKASFEIHQLSDAIEELRKFYQEEQSECGQLKNKLDEITHSLAVIERARAYSDVCKEQGNVLKIQQKIDAKRLDEKELLPERNRLGYHLKQYYKQQIKECDEERAGLAKDYEAVEAVRKEVVRNLEQSRKEEREWEHKKTVIEQHRKSYDKQEMQFNAKFQTALQLNILGYYEDDALHLLQQSKEQQKKELDSDIVKLKKEQCDVEKEFKNIDNTIQEIREERGQVQEKTVHAQSVIEGYQERLQQVKTALQYISFEESRVFDVIPALEEFDARIMETLAKKKQHEMLHNSLVSEKNQLESGRLLQLPAEVEDFFESCSISYIYGMDYVKEHKELLDVNPLIPYSIILSEAQLSHLKQQAIPFYTSYPIPVICREHLHDAAKTGTAVDLFYSFNQHLLDEEELAGLISDKMNEIQMQMDIIEQLDEDISVYRENRNIVEFKSVTQGVYQNAQREWEQLKQQSNDLDCKIKDWMLRSDRLNEQKETLRGFMQNKEEALQTVTLLLDALRELIEEYEQYEKDWLYLGVVKKRLEQEQENQRVLNQRVVELDEHKEDLKEKQRDNAQHEKDLQAKSVVYESYQTGEILALPIEEVEARYEAVTSQMQGEIRELEEELKTQQLSLTQKQNNLKRLQDKYLVEPSQYETEKVDDYKEKRLEDRKAEFEETLDKTRRKVNALDKELGIKESDYNRLCKELKKQFDTSQPLPKQELAKQDFELRRQQLVAHGQEIQLRLEQIRKQSQHYQSNLDALEEYSDFRTAGELGFEEELWEYGVNAVFDLQMKEFTCFRASLIQQYRKIERELQTQKDQIARQIDDLRYVKRYQDEFFMKPLQSLRDMVSTPVRLLEQLRINLESFAAQLKKLEIDIAFIDEEKSQLIELLLDYTLDVHKHLGLIDRNSTITLYGKSLKMLQIELMDVSTNHDMLMLKLKDYVENITNLSLKLLQENNNIEEMIGKRITTKELYDTVIGLHSVRIHLYKIEEHGERRITWSEVCKNSGGEGFLSAFVVLSSLLSYMRRDETQVMNHSEEGKVLVMDNPFAQTNAAHLLIPLMEVAKKSNTQLICLTGLGGESIYNCFDNIYVLNLVSSPLNAVEYLKGEHIKGDIKEYVIQSSRFKVENAKQMELIF